MSSTELDMPLVPSADQIRRREFVTIRRGYDPEQVRAYLRHVGDQVEHLEGQLRQARAEAIAMADARVQEQAEVARAAERQRNDAYDELASRLADLLRAAERQADELRLSAEEGANRMLADARAEADKIRIDSQEKAEQVRADAEALMSSSRAEADRMLSELNTRRETVVAELEEMQERMLGMVHSIGDIAVHEPAEDAPRSESAGSPPATYPQGAEPSAPEHDFPTLRLPETPVFASPPKADDQPRVTDDPLSDPVFQMLWGDDAADPLGDLPAPTLDDVEPEDPFAT